MTNKYLIKIAASVQDEKDSAKTFGKTWLTGHAGVLAGAALGGVALGSKPGRKLLVGLRRSRVGRGVQNIANDVKGSRVGQTAGKWFGHKKGPAAIGGIAGGIVGGDIGDYVGIRHGIINSKKQDDK